MLAGQRRDISIAVPGTSVSEGKDQPSTDSRVVMAFFQYVSLQLWRDLIDSLVSHSLWLRALLGLPEKETIYLDMPEEQGQTLCTSAQSFPSLCPGGSGALAICALLVEPL